MIRRAMALLITLGLLVAPLGATSSATRARIAVLGLPSAPPASALPPREAAFHQELHKLGWVEGQNLTIEWRWAEGSLERFATLVQEMVHLPVDVMVVPNRITALIAQEATTTIPIIIAGGGALAHRVPNLARPGGNVTGFAGLGPELAPKRLELLAHVVPGVTRVAVLRGLAGQDLERQAMEAGARALGVSLQHLPKIIARGMGIYIIELRASVVPGCHSIAYGQLFGCSASYGIDVHRPDRSRRLIPLEARVRICQRGDRYRCQEWEAADA
jgi:putative ABC transport system substrate-binding protein